MLILLTLRDSLKQNFWSVSLIGFLPSGQRCIWAKGEHSEYELPNCQFFAVTMNKYINRDSEFLTWNFYIRDTIFKLQIFNVFISFQLVLQCQNVRIVQFSVFALQKVHIIHTHNFVSFLFPPSSGGGDRSDRKVF